MSKFIYPSQLLISKEDFFDTVSSKLEEALTEFKSKDVSDRESNIKVWIYININLIKDAYLVELRETLKEDYGWEKVQVEKQDEGGGKIFINLSLI
jgi:hypothetical protein